MTAGPKAPAVQATVLGYPRIGRRRELKRATEGYWAGTVSAQQLLATGAAVRRQNWQSLAAAGIAEVPVNDFSFYDHVGDMIQLLGAVPSRHRVKIARGVSGAERTRAGLDEYFAMARGTESAAPLEMTKWFDTNYHSDYLYACLRTRAPTDALRGAEMRLGIGKETTMQICALRLWASVRARLVLSAPAKNDAGLTTLGESGLLGPSST